MFPQLIFSTAYEPVLAKMGCSEVAFYSDESGWRDHEESEAHQLTSHEKEKGLSLSCNKFRIHKKNDFHSLLFLFYLLILLIPSKDKAELCFRQELEMFSEAESFEVYQIPLTLTTYKSKYV